MMNAVLRSRRRKFREYYRAISHAAVLAEQPDGRDGDGSRRLPPIFRREPARVRIEVVVVMGSMAG